MPASAAEARGGVTAIESNFSAAGDIQHTTEGCQAHGILNMSNRQQLGGDADGEIYKGKIVDFGSGQEVVMQVNEDGSFATVPYSLNSYSAMARSRCQHRQWKQLGNAVFQQRVWVHGKTTCYTDRFHVKYRCTNPRCKLTRTMDTYIRYKHHYSKNRCTQCGMRKQ